MVVIIQTYNALKKLLIIKNEKMKTIKILAILLVVLSASCQKAKVDTLVSAKGHLK